MEVFKSGFGFSRIGSMTCGCCEATKRTRSYFHDGLKFHLSLSTSR